MDSFGLAGRDEAATLATIRKSVAAFAPDRWRCSSDGCPVKSPHLLWLDIGTGHVFCSDGENGHLQELLDELRAAAECVNVQDGELRSFPDNRRIVTPQEHKQASKAGTADACATVDPSKTKLLAEIKRTLVGTEPDTRLDAKTTSSAAGGSDAEVKATAASAADAEADPGGVQAVAEPGAPPSLAEQQAELVYHPESGIVGLHNLGNTCFLNSALQALLCVPQFARSLVELEHTAYRATSSRAQTIASSLQWLARYIWGGDGPREAAISPNRVLSTLRRVNRMFAGYRQHDSHEALRFMLSDMHETLAQPHHNWISDDTGLSAGTSLASVASSSSSSSSWSPSSYSSSSSSSASSSTSTSVSLISPVAAAAAAAASAAGSPTTSAATDDARAADPDATYHWANGSSGKEGGASADRSTPGWCSAGPYQPPPSLLRSPVSDAFEGISCSRVRCRTCKKESVTMDTFMDLSLSIPEAAHPAVDSGAEASGAAGTARVARSGFPKTGSSRSGWCSFNGWVSRGLSVADCLHNYCDPSPLTEDNQYRCEHCGCLRDADKATCLVRLPEVLCVHLKRFAHTGMWGKLSTRVSFPLQGLDLAPFVWKDGVLAAERIVSDKRARERAAAAAAKREWEKRTGEALSGERPVAPPAPPPVLSDTPFSDDLAARVVAEARQAAALKAAGVAAGEQAYGCGPGEGPTTYELVSLVQHLGSMGGGHYIAFGKHRLSNEWLCFNDSRVTTVSPSSVAGQEAYILLFRRTRAPPTARMPMPMPAPGGRERDSSDVFCWVSAQWWLRRRAFACPGPITCYDVACPHGRLSKHLRLAATDPRDGRFYPTQYLVPLTEAQFAFLVASFGRHGPVIRDLRPCPACKREARALQARRAAEAKAILSVDTKSIAGKGAAPGSDCWHLIGASWVQRWHAFKDNDESLEDGTGRGALPPGPIDNSCLLRASGKPKGNLRAAVHYRGVNGSVWDFFHDIYGGGPLMRRRRRIDIYEKAVDDIPVDLLGTVRASAAGKPIKSKSDGES